MKTLIALSFALFIGITAQAQDSSEKVIGKEIKVSIDTPVTAPSTDQVARLYKFSNARVKGALVFTTKGNTAMKA